MGTTRGPLTPSPSPPGHPHACGDYDHRGGRALTPGGSSPRVWGLPACSGRRPLKRRVIPTRVGTTPRPPSCWRPHEGHPHACGDYARPGAICTYGPGSSPRVWGLRGFPLTTGTSWRVIPTRVGTTGRPEVFSEPFKGHPHACGDYGPHDARPEGRRGSSPRVWGLLAEPR